MWVRLPPLPLLEGRQILVCCARLLSESTDGSEGSIPLPSAKKDKVAEWLRQWSAKSFFMSSNLILVSKILEVLSNWLARLTVNQVQK